MDDPNTQLQQDIRELKAEVRRLRLLIEGVVLIIGIGLVLLIPNLLVMGISLAGLILFGFLVSRQRKLIFRSLCQGRDKRKHDL
jgi:hypothetical protein